MTKRYLRNKNDGFIYGYNEILAANPDVEEVTEAEAFGTKAEKKPVTKAKPAAKPADDLSIESILGE
jgi:hypothetical protein